MTIKIALTNLGKYNEGALVYTWLELPATEEEIESAKKEIGINANYEEWFISDYETDIPGLKIGEYDSVTELNELAETLDSMDEYDSEHLAAYIEATGYSLAESLESFEDTTYYSGQTILDVAYDLIDECYNLPEIAQRYFDYEAFARDLSLEGYTETSTGTICTY